MSLFYYLKQRIGALLTEIEMHAEDVAVRSITGRYEHDAATRSSRAAAP